MNRLRMAPLRMALAGLALALGVAAAAPAAAIGLDAARAQGLVGETRSGYIAPVRTPTAEVQALIEKVNAERRQRYRSIAQRNSLPIEEVGRLTAEKLINALPGGVYYQSAAGAWQQK